MRGSWLLVVASLGWASVVAADETSPLMREPKLSMRDKRKHLAATVQLGSAWRAIFPFDEEYCGEDDAAKAYCSGRAPVVLGLALEYGLTRNLEALIGIDVGLERDFGVDPNDDEGPRVFALSPGLKLYLTELGPGDLASTAELLIDSTSYDQADESDLGVRNRSTWEIPISKNFWAQLYLGETASWKRWFRFQVDFGLGALVRL
jgi:hypothetical protein